MEILEIPNIPGIGVEIFLGLFFCLQNFKICDETLGKIEKEILGFFGTYFGICFGTYFMVRGLESKVPFKHYVQGKKM